MVTFVSLFLGLVFGVHPVEVLVGEDVAAVEIRLDGELVGRLEGEPWRVDCDFGELEPRELVAVSFDAEGKELGRARQWVNLPQPHAEVGVVLEKDADGRALAARLSWESIVGDPLTVYASLDGKPLVVQDPRRIALPPAGTDQLHFLRLRLEFPRDVSAVEELPFGGTFSGEAAGELTAVLVRTEAKDLRPSDLEGRLHVDGEPLQVVGVEQGPAEVVLVLDRAYIGEDLPVLLRQFIRQVGVRYSQNPAVYEGIVRRELAQVMTLRKETRARWMWPVPVSQPSDLGGYEVFSPSPPIDASRKGVLDILANVEPPKLRGAQRLADAVAAAARTTSRDRRRRAVVLTLSAEPRDESRLTTEQARRYLADLQVPLHVWWAAKKVPADTAWGPGVPTPTSAALIKAVRRLQDDLDSQWVVWVSGLHLPHRIELSGGGTPIHLLGKP